MGNRHNLNISLTDELWQRMEKFSEVNWSSIARKAFEAYVEKREMYIRLQTGNTSAMEVESLNKKEGLGMRISKET
jgi:hypothetical protein